MVGGKGGEGGRGKHLRGLNVPACLGVGLSSGKEEREEGRKEGRREGGGREGISAWGGTNTEHGELSASAPGPPLWGPRLARILRGLLPPKPRERGPSGNDFHGAEAYMQAQDEFKAVFLQEKAAYNVWFKRVGRNKYAMFDEVA